MLKQFLFTFLLLFSAYGLFAQTTDLGMPKSWNQKITALQAAPVYNMPAFDLEEQQRIDAINEADKIGPWRFGYEFAVNHGLEQGGVWTNLPNGDRIWRIAFRSEGALSMNLIFDDYLLPEGAHVQLYSLDRKARLGAYTAKNNHPDRMLGTSLLQGESIVIEYFEPAAVAGEGKLHIGTLVHGYRDVRPYAEELVKALNSSGDCNIDVNCPLGNNWRNQINSVGIMMSGGSGFCTGALINNTAQDGTPYFLTANHCMSGSPATWVFRFNWESPNAVCAQAQNSTDPGTPYNEVNGATLKASDAGTDFALLELSTLPAAPYYLAGWDRSSTAANGAICVHHPSGDVKKISKENQSLSTATFSGADTWQVANWDEGTTEQGSSGSPLFNLNGLIIGQLYGGGAACSGLVNNGSEDYYGRFDISWDGAGASSSRLKDWLDPNNSNVQTLTGFGPGATGPVANDAGLNTDPAITGVICGASSISPSIEIYNGGSSTLTSATILYNINGGSNQAYSWSGNLASNNSETVSLSSLNISAAGPQTFSATVTVPNGQVDSNSVNDVISADFYAITQPVTFQLDLKTDCYASETSWEVRDANGILLYSKDSYTSNTPTLYSEPLCLQENDCYDFTIFDSYGDGMEGTLYNCAEDGDYHIISPANDTVVNMASAAFGSSSTDNFCTSLASSIQEVSLLRNLQLYPNPSKGQLQLELSLEAAQDVRLALYNSLGQMVWQQNYGELIEQNIQLDFSAFAAGAYYLQIQLPTEQLGQKIILQD